MKQSASTPPRYGKRLKQERERLGLSQQALAEKVDASFVTISNWERGKTMPGPYHRRLLSELFGKSLQELGLLPGEPEEGHQAPTESFAPAPHETSSVSESSARIWNIPYARNLYFTGREEVLQHLHDTLLSTGTAALTQPQAISGLGGLGKTQTAVEYAYRYRDFYSIVLWVRADAYEMLVSDFVTLAGLLHMPEKDEEDQSRVVRAIKRYLESNSQWLLILDNVEDLEMVSAFIPVGAQGHTLLTTRTPTTGTIAQGVEIERMEPTVGAWFLLHRAKLLALDAPLEKASVTDQARAKDIVEVMDGLPLALDQAGAYIEETACSLSDYLALFRTRRTALLKRRGRLVANHAEPVATTWSLAFEKVEQSNPAAADLLRLCAFLHPDAIPEALILEGAAELGPVLEPVVNDSMEFNDAIHELRRFSLVRRDSELRLLTIHRLVQAVLKDRMDEQTQRQWAERAVRAVNAAFPEGTFAHWERCQQYLPHALAAAQLIEDYGFSFPEATQLLTHAGCYLKERAEFEQAEPLTKHALFISEQTCGDAHPATAAALHNLAGLYADQGRYAEAEPLHQRALTIREHVLGSGHPDTAETLNDLAVLYSYQGDYQQAEPLLQRALRIREQAQGCEHPQIAAPLNNLAIVYCEQGNYQQAEPLLQRALHLDEHTFGQEHPEVAYSLTNLAIVYYKQGRYGQAEPLYQRALHIREQMLGCEHPQVAFPLNGLADLYRDQGRYGQAEPLYQRALTINERALGPEHPETATTLDNLAQLYQAQGQDEQAKVLFQRALAMRERILGQEHRDTVAVRERYTHLQAHMKGVQEAVEPMLPKPSSAPSLSKTASSPAGMTAREVEVLHLVASGLSNAQVAERLAISARTIDTHLTSIYSKIGVSSRSAATRYAMEHHLV